MSLLIVMYHFRRGIFLHKRQFYSFFADGHLYTDLQQNVQHGSRSWTESFQLRIYRGSKRGIGMRSLVSKLTFNLTTVHPPRSVAISVQCYQMRSEPTNMFQCLKSISCPFACWPAPLIHIFIKIYHDLLWFWSISSNNVVEFYVRPVRRSWFMCFLLQCKLVPPKSVLITKVPTNWGGRVIMKSYFALFALGAKNASVSFYSR